MIHKEAGDYGSDTQFVRNAYASKIYSKLRSSMAGVYAWRVKNSESAEEKQRMVKAADFAFRQACALCPYSSEAVFRYTSFLVDQGRKKDALLLAETAQRIDPRNSSLANLAAELEKQK